MMRNNADVTEAAILEKIVDPRSATLEPAAARSLLGLQFDRASTQAIRRLLRKNNLGTITAAERLALEKYIRVGQFLDLVHAKAQLSLQTAAETT